MDKKSPLHYILTIFDFWDFFRNSNTLYQIGDYFCEIFYHLSVKNLQEQSSLPSCTTSTILR